MRLQRSFTILELLVVMALLALLAAILWPVLAEARAMARQTSCLSNMRQLGQAMRLYADNWDEALPGAGDFGTGGGWIACPREGDLRPEEGALWPLTGNRMLYRCLAARGAVSYSMNHDLAFQSLATVTDPAGVLLFLDEAEGAGFPNDGAFYADHEAQDRLTERHHGGGNLVWLDGHAGWKPAAVRGDRGLFDPTKEP